MSTPVRALRWICVLPGALLCVVLVAFPIHWIVMLIQIFGRSNDSFITVDGKNLLAAIPPEHLERFGQALFAPFAFVSGGAWIAPSQRLRTGVVLAVILAALLIVLHTYVAYVPSANFTLTGGWFQRGLTHLLQIGGLSWGLYRAREMEKKAASPQPGPVAIAAHNRFSAASDAFDAAYAAGETYETRANHRYTILAAARSTHNADAYNEEIAGYSDPADFEPYTDAYLAAHTVAIDNLAAAFDTLTDAFAAFSRTDHLYRSATAVYKATTALYVVATNAYANAAHCAMTTALEGNLTAAKNDFEVMLLEGKAANATATDATAKAVAFKANATKEAAAAKRLEQKATEAQFRAKALCADASSAAANAAEVLEASQ